MCPNKGLGCDSLLNELLQAEWTRLLSVILNDKIFHHVFFYIIFFLKANKEFLTLSIAY
ncbi:Uncharacterised protein [Segatella copri]|nr:Uncharacterised protein [Segatella copri]